MGTTARTISSAAAIAVVSISTTAFAMQTGNGAAVSSPLITNDLAGVVKFISFIVGLVLLPLGGLIVYFLKRGSDAQLAEIQRSNDAKLAELKRSNDVALAQMQQIVNGFGERMNGISSAVGRVDERVSGYDKALAGDRIEIMGAISASSERQLTAMHDVELKVAGVAARNDLGPCLTEFGKSIEKLAASMIDGNRALVQAVLEAVRSTTNVNGIRKQ